MPQNSKPPQEFSIHHIRAKTRYGADAKKMERILPDRHCKGDPYKVIRARAEDIKENVMFEDWVGVRLYAVDAKTKQTLARCNVLRSALEHQTVGGKFRLKINLFEQKPDGTLGGVMLDAGVVEAHPLTAIKEAVRECIAVGAGDEDWTDWYAEAVHAKTEERLGACRFQDVIEYDRALEAAKSADAVRPMGLGVGMEKQAVLER